MIKSKMNPTPSLKDVDSYNADIVANASRFAASLFLGRGKYANAEANTREEIETLAAKLKADNPHINGKPVIVCFDPDGNQSMISGKPYKEHKKPKTPKQAVSDAVNKAIEAGAPVFENQPAVPGEKGVTVDDAIAKAKAAKPARASAPKKTKAKGGDHPLVANLKKAMKSAKPAKAAAKAKPAKAKAKPAKAKAKAKPNGNGSTRPRGAKWEAARKLLTAKGGTARAPLFEALKWRSMDQNLLAKGTGLVITKLDTGNYAGKEA